MQQQQQMRMQQQQQQQQAQSGMPARFGTPMTTPGGQQQQVQQQQQPQQQMGGTMGQDQTPQVAILSRKWYLRIVIFSCCIVIYGVFAK